MRDQSDMTLLTLGFRLIFGTDEAVYFKFGAQTEPVRRASAYVWQITTKGAWSGSHDLFIFITCGSKLDT